VSVIGKIKKGFTLVELLVVIVIIGVIAGVLFLAMAPMDNKAKKEVCYYNRALIVRALETYRLSNGLSKETYTLQSFINDKYKDTMSTNNAKCPSGGIYTAGTDENGREIVLCSVHSVTSGGGGLPAGSFYIPGTGDTIVGKDVWNSPGRIVVDGSPTTWGNTYVHIKKNEKFFYNDVYYIAVKDSGTSGFWVSGYHPDITPDGLNPDAYANAEGLVKLTGFSEEWSSDKVNNGNTLIRGDIIYDNGNYYVCMTTSYTIRKTQWDSNPPSKNLNEWSQLSN